MSHMKAVSLTHRQYKHLTTQVSEETKPHRMRQTACIHDGKINRQVNFRSRTIKAADKRLSEVLISKMLNEFSDVFSGICCFEGTSGLQIEDGSQLYQVPLLEGQHVLYRNS